MAWRAALAQAVGGRELQQDSAAFAFDRSGNFGYAVVADGLGGHEGGERASAAAAAAVAAVWDRNAADPGAIDPRTFLRSAVALAHQSVVTLNLEARLSARTTICCAFLSGEKVTVANVGDTRAYLAGPRELVRLSRDHSVPQMLVAQGSISEEQMRGHPDADLLTQALGGDEAVRPYVARGVAVRAGERLLLCSDGLWQAISSADLAVRLAKGSDPAALVAAAAGPGSDNVTAIVLDREASGMNLLTRLLRRG